MKNAAAFRPALAILLTTFLSGCVSLKYFVDPSVPVLSPAELPKVAAPMPATVLFEFVTDSTVNARATSLLRGRVVAAVAESGMFANLAPSVPAEAAILKIRIENIGQVDSRFRSQMSGYTLGMVGSSATDHYICTAAYVRAGREVNSTVSHTIHSTFGNHASPSGATAMLLPDAVNQIADQLVWHALKELHEYGAFSTE